MRRICCKLQIMMLGLSLGAIALPATGCRSTTRGFDNASRWTAAQAELLRGAGERLGVPVRTEAMLNLAQGGASLSTAPAANFETIPATELPRGVTFAVATVDSPDQGVPKGTYALRAFAEPRQVGTVEGRVQLVDAGGRVAGELPARIEIESMSLPSVMSGVRTSIFLQHERLAGHCNLNYETCYCCENGYIVCVSKLFVPRLAAELAAR
jgi:hypothetical protein